MEEGDSPSFGRNPLLRSHCTSACISVVGLFQGCVRLGLEWVRWERSEPGVALGRQEGSSHEVISRVGCSSLTLPLQILLQQQANGGKGLTTSPDLVLSYISGHSHRSVQWFALHPADARRHLFSQVLRGSTGFLGVPLDSRPT